MCDRGIIESRIELVTEPYLGGSTTDISVDFVCTKCGHSWAGEAGLPSTLKELNEFINREL